VGDDNSGARGSAYFHRIDTRRFLAAPLVGGAWNISEQHVAPALGLIAHAMERHHAAGREAPLRLSRLSFDIFGVMPIGEVAIVCSTIRAGRTIELVEARLDCEGRTAILARGWFVQRLDTAALSGSSFLPIAPVGNMPPWTYEEIWAGAFVRSIEVRRIEREPGRAQGWIRTPHMLLEGEPVSALAHAVGLLDLANGLTPRADPGRAAFPNLDLTASFFRAPQGDWLGFDTTVSFGPDGIGLTHSVIHDAEGPVGTVSQSLTIRPQP
jgi:hypothetical protein